MSGPKHSFLMKTLTVVIALALVLGAPIFARDWPAELDRLRSEIDITRTTIAGKPALLALLPDVEICHAMLARTLATSPEELAEKKPTAAVAEKLLAESRTRNAALKRGESPWLTERPVLRGYRSRVDDTFQPYLISPPMDGSQQPRQAYVALPDGGQRTDLLYLTAGWGKTGTFLGRDSGYQIQVLARGNQGVLAGKTAIFESIDAACAAYPIDRLRLFIHGFSRGGTIAWKLVTHQPDLWRGASPGGGFVNTEDFGSHMSRGDVPWFEYLLYRYDNAADYAANLATGEVFAYDGAVDSHRHMHDFIAPLAAREGVFLRRILAPGVDHRPDRNASVPIMEMFDRLAVVPAEWPQRVRFTTWHLRYSKCHWIEIERLRQHWQRADLAVQLDSTLSTLTFHCGTANVQRFTIAITDPRCPLKPGNPVRFLVDGNAIEGPPFQMPYRVTFDRLEFTHMAGTKKDQPRVFANWKVLAPDEIAGKALAKKPKLAGPIDDAFNDRFLVVPPEGIGFHPDTQTAASAALDEARATWARFFRGSLREKAGREITSTDLADSHLILFGDPKSNPIIARILPQLPIQWTSEKLTVAGHTYTAAQHLPLLIFPNPLNPARYVVLNSGSSTPGIFGTGRDHTPKLPDWAVLDVAKDRKSKAALVAAGFFDEAWSYATWNESAARVWSTEPLSLTPNARKPASLADLEP